MSHFIGAVFKYLAAAAIFIFSVSLSYTYFSAIAPGNMPWFTWAALGLTEIGFICWLAVFMLQRHNDAHKTIAFLMIFVCVAAVLFTDAVELSRMFGTTFFLTQFYYYGLIVLLLAHFLAFTMDFFVSYFEKYSFSGGGTKIRYSQNGNLIPTSGGYNRPLALRNQPKDMTYPQMGAVSLGQVAASNQNQIPQQTTATAQEEEEVVTLSQVAQGVGAAVKSGASSVMKRVSHAKKPTKMEPAPVHGQVNAITIESTSTDSTGKSEEEGA